MKTFLGRRIAVPVWALAVGALVLVGLGAATATGDKEQTDVSAGSTSTTTTTAPTTTTLSPAEQAAADQAAAERAAADKAAAEKAAADKAAAEKAAADKAAADKAAAEKAEADRLAAERAAAAPRTLTGSGSKVTAGFTLLEAGYRVSWVARGSGTDNFILHIRSADGRKEALVNEIYPEPASGEEFFDSPGGEFFLVVDASELSWTVTLTKI